MDVLLVDDSKTMRMLIQRTLRQAGFRGLTIGEAESGADALEQLQSAKPRLILSDWNMPVMDGIDFLRNLRAGQNKTPFGFITSEASAEIRELALNTGASFLLTKPLTPEAMEQALTPYL